MNANLDKFSRRGSMKYMKVKCSGEGKPIFKIDDASAETLTIGSCLL